MRRRYLCNADPDGIHYNPYNLEVVPHADVKASWSQYLIWCSMVTHTYDSMYSVFWYLLSNA
jgi:hypothetical protein